MKAGRDDRSWLLLKKRDGYAGRGDPLAANRSVVSGRTLEELLAAAPATTAGERKIEQLRFREALESTLLQTAPLGPMPHDVRPMLATLAEEPFDDPEWLFEVKWDGYRAIAELRDGAVSLYSRNLLPLNRHYPPLVEALRKFRVEAVLDGEIVVVDERGEPDFQLLQQYRTAGGGHLLYYVFDLLYFQGHDLTGLPLLGRKELLKTVLPSLPHVRFSDHVRKDGVLFFRAAKGKGLEGIVAKHVGSTYRSGSRSRLWLKVKTRPTREGVIAGFTAPRGGRRAFGTLILGAYVGDELVYIGHAGGGFTARELREIRARLAPLIRDDCPFAVVPPTNAPATWVTPELVCEVALAGWTEDGIMRQPVFRRLREDKAAAEVVFDRPAEEREP